ncbi:MAG: ankyrin repeat domain-containing protein [Rickettsiaceae bacterium]|nr:ankyrin repeat domain-containing protein [Rickettsiaceae bacterium]
MLQKNDIISYSNLLKFSSETQFIINKVIDLIYIKDNIKLAEYLNIVKDQKEFRIIEKECIQWEDINSCNLAHHAICWGNGYALNLLFNEQIVLANPFKKNINGDTILHLAAALNDLATINWLLQFKTTNIAACLEPNKNGNTPLHLCADFNSTKVIKPLIELTIQNADNLCKLSFNMSSNNISLINEPLTPSTIQNLILTKYNTIVKLGLLNNLGDTPLHIATKKNFVELMRMLLEENANVDAKNKYNQTPLHFAVYNNSAEAVDLILSCNPNVSLACNFGLTALHISTYHGLLAITTKLVTYGANIHLKNREGFTPLHYSCLKPDDTKKFKSAHTEITELLLKVGALANVANLEGDTPLHAAVRFNNLESAKILLKYNAQVNTENKYGDTALHISVKQNSYDFVELLLNNGAFSNSQSLNGETPLHYININSDTKIIKLLLKKNANPYLTNSLGNSFINLVTLLHSLGRTDILDLILSNNPDIHNTNLLSTSNKNISNSYSDKVIYNVSDSELISPSHQTLENESKKLQKNAKPLLFLVDANLSNYETMIKYVDSSLMGEILKN